MAIAETYRNPGTGELMVKRLVSRLDVARKDAGVAEPTIRNKSTVRLKRQGHSYILSC